MKIGIAGESVFEEKDPDTAFVKWLKDKYNKSPRDLKGDEYVKMSKELQAKGYNTELSLLEKAVKYNNKVRNEN